MALDSVEKIREIVVKIMTLINEKKKTGERLVGFDLSDCPRMVFGPIIMSTLAKVGYISYILLSGGKDENEEDVERLYIDMAGIQVMNDASPDRKGNV